ncbi:MAG TPA: hypothetical protein VE153_29040, partial [Myxococcus sp.]|nr:hypothetical protein [Myxococcus sp.]
DGADEDAGTPSVVDLCNSREEALTQEDCALRPGQPLERFLALEGDVQAGDQDWYRIELPANTSARTLLNVKGAYLAASTAVNLSITVLEPGGGTNGNDIALAKKEDKHGQGAPRPVDMVLPLRQSLAGKTLLVLVQDSPDVPTRPNFDARSPYRLTVEITENPDAQEPNDTRETATPLTLATQGDQQVGTATGFLATDNDVDQFTFNLPAGKVAYVRVNAPDQGFVPNWRLSYELRRPTYTEKEAEGQVRPQVRGGVLATARKVETAGTWTLVVRGYRPTERDIAQGDLVQRYEVEVRVLDEADAQDMTTRGNNALQDALLRSLEGSSPGSPGAAVSFTGRIGSTEDDDWYGVRLPAFDAPTVLRYRVVPLATGGRFPPLPGTPDRVVRVFTSVTLGGNVSDWRTNCINNATACPKGYGESPAARQLVEGYCVGTDVSTPLCTHSSREEVVDNPRFSTPLSNFRGALPVPRHGTPVTYYFVVQDDGTDWADDRDYRLEVSWDAEDADELARTSTGTEQPVSRTLEFTSAFPRPPGDAAYSMSGQLSHGHGRLRGGTDRRDGLGVRGPNDYDAVPSDVDSYAFQLPSVAAPEDRAWLLEWQVDKLADGGTPHGMALDLTFCDGDARDGGACTQVTVGSRNQPLTLGYTPDALRAWHTPSGASLSSLQPLFLLEDRPNATVVTLAPYACGCLERRFIRGGTLRVDVSASERLDYERVNYTLRTGWGNYPTRYTVDGGASVSCPAPVQDGGVLGGDGGVQPVYSGGCAFTRQP